MVWENGCAGQWTDSSSSKSGLVDAACWWLERCCLASSRCSRAFVIARMSHSLLSNLSLPTPRSLLPRGNIQRTRGCMRNHHLSELFIVKEGGKDAALRIEQPAAAGPWVVCTYLPIITACCRTTHSLVYELHVILHATMVLSGVSTPRNAKYTD
jgi:hypothetical protein